MRRERCLREDLEELLNREEQMWAQKARYNWTLFGDRNTRYFQIVVKQKRARSRILHKKNGERNLIDNPNEIEDVLENHFKSSYEDPNPPSVNSILQTYDFAPII